MDESFNCKDPVTVTTFLQEFNGACDACSIHEVVGR